MITMKKLNLKKQHITPNRNNGFGVGDKKGFTIIESLVAISILTLSIAGASSMVQTSLRLTQSIKEEGRAVGLAVEGLEYARNIHDRDLYDGNTYDVDGLFYDFVQLCSAGCSIEVGAVNDGDVILDPSHAVCGNGCKLLVSNTGYQTTSTTRTQESNFERKLTIVEKPIDGGTEIKITSQVDYVINNSDRTVSFDSYHFAQDPPVPELPEEE